MGMDARWKIPKAYVRRDASFIGNNPSSTHYFSHVPLLMKMKPIKFTSALRFVITDTDYGYLIE